MMIVKYRYTRPQVATRGVASRNDTSMLACGQKVGVNAITSVIPTGIRTAEKTRLKASNALSSRTRPVALRTNKFLLLAGGWEPVCGSAVATAPSCLLRGRNGGEWGHCRLTARL